MLTLDFTSSSWFWSPSTFLLHRTEPQRGQPSQEPLSAVPLPALCQAYDPSKHRQNWAVLLLGWFQHRDPPSTKRGVGRSKEKSWRKRPREPALQTPVGGGTERSRDAVPGGAATPHGPSQPQQHPGFPQTRLHCKTRDRGGLTLLLFHTTDVSFSIYLLNCFFAYIQNWPLCWHKGLTEEHMPIMLWFDQDGIIEKKNYPHSTWHKLSLLACKTLDC